MKFEVKNLKDTFTFLQEEFNAICINEIEAINQNGIYLFFDGMEQNSPTLDLARFCVVIAENTLDKDNLYAIDLLSKIRLKIAKLGDFNGFNYFNGIKAGSFPTNSLYIFVAMLKINVKIY